MVKYFGVLVDIVNDRDTRFTGRFWTVLFNMMGSNLKFCTANHPQIDGQTERINHLLEDVMTLIVIFSVLSSVHRLERSYSDSKSFMTCWD